MATTVDDLTISYFEEGVETVKELDKEVLTKQPYKEKYTRNQPNDWSN